MIFIYDWYLYDIYSKYAWVFPLKDKKSIAITNDFQNFLKESYRKPNKIWVDKGSEFYNRSMKSFLQNNNIEMFSTHNGRRFVIVERFIRTLKNNIYKYITSISKDMYINKLDDIINKYNITCHRKNKMKPVDVRPSTYIVSNK